jgi:hypothetical protein
MKTALTRDFRETVQARVKRDATFRKRLLSEAIESLLSGEVVRSRTRENLFGTSWKPGARIESFCDCKYIFV